jgi:hypothetical protein
LTISRRSPDATTCQLIICNQIGISNPETLQLKPIREVEHLQHASTNPVQSEQFSPQRWCLQTSEVIKLSQYRRLLETRVKSRRIWGIPACPARIGL